MATMMMMVMMMLASVLTMVWMLLVDKTIVGKIMVKMMATMRFK